MRRRVRRLPSYRRSAPPVSDRDLGDVLRTAFGSREEMREMFREVEARMVEDMHAMCEQAKRARDQVWSVPPEDDLSAADRPAQPPVKPK
jgi:hypothetical protein